jgi:HAD superfamily hydrolase (TIGR01450 family)
MHSPIERVTIDELIDRYDALLFDAYGVLVHLSGAMPGAPGLIDLLNRSHKPYCLITNDASKLPVTAAQRYRGFGLDVDAGHIVTSGELLRRYFTDQDLDGARCAVLGTTDSVRYVELAGGAIVPPDAAFDVLVVGDQTGYPLLDTVDTALTSLFHRIDAGQPVRLILPNPDLIYLRSEHSFGLAAGSVALLFEAALRRRYADRDDLVFTRLGKPGPLLYEEGMRRCATRNVVMLGDQIETDIRGANRCGIASALVTTGISAPDLDALTGDSRPTYWMSSIEHLTPQPAPATGRGGL